MCSWYNSRYVWKKYCTTSKKFRFICYQVSNRWSFRFWKIYRMGCHNSTTNVSKVGEDAPTHSNKPELDVLHNRHKSSFCSVNIACSLTTITDFPPPLLHLRPLSERKQRPLSGKLRTFALVSRWSRIKLKTQQSKRRPGRSIFDMHIVIKRGIIQKTRSKRTKTPSKLLQVPETIPIGRTCC